MAGEDILFRAEVDDGTIDFFNRFDRNLERIADSAEQGFDRVEKGSKKGAVAAGALAGVVAGLTTKLLDMGAAALQAFTSFVKGSVQLRARVDVLGTTLQLVGQKAGYSAEQIAATEEEVKSLGITTQASRQALIRLTRANIDWSEAANLARIAQNSAVVAGINSSQAFERLILGIQKQEPELLDELGIQLRRTDAYKKLADELGKTTKELTEAEKQQAILNEIYRQSEVVSGAYEAAMGNVGKQVTSLPRLFEELQLAIGGAFQPAYGVQVSYITEKLKELKQWVDDNQEAIEGFGRFLANALELAFETLDRLLEAASQLPSIIENMGIGLAKILSDMDDAEVEAQAQRHVTLERLGQLVSLIVGFFAFAAEAVKQQALIIVDAIKLIPAAVEGDFDAALTRLQDRMRNAGDVAYKAFQDGTASAAEFFGIIKREAPAAADAMDDFTESLDEGIVEEADDSEEAIKKVNDALDDLYDKMQEDIEAHAIQELRRQQEEAIRLSHRMEDIERNYQESISKLQSDYARDRQDLAEDGQKQIIKLHEDRAKNAIRIEQDYRKRLKEIQIRFEEDAKELARQRDAIGLLRLQRRHQQELDQERRQADERKRTNDERFNERLSEIQETLREQEVELRESFERQAAEIEEQRNKQVEALERQIARDREIRELHNQWLEEDRQRQFEKELKELAEQFAGMEGLTEEGLAEVLAVWEEYFGDLSVLQEEFAALQAELSASQAAISSSLAAGGAGSRPTYGSQVPTTTTDDDSIWAGSEGDTPSAGPAGGTSDPGAANPSTPVHEELRPGGSRVIGQAGQVSQHLAAFGGRMPAMFLPQRIPTVMPQRSRGIDRREIIVKAEGFSPLVERQIIQVLTEIERNRG